VAVSVEMSPRLQSAFASLRQESASVTPRPAAMTAARAAMHGARIAPGSTRGGALPMFGDRLRRIVTPGRLIAAGGGLVTGVATVALLGWNAPAGTPLHVVRLAHEQIALVVPGVDRTGLELSYAESRLHDAIQGTSTAASLDEASRLLADVHGRLPADRAAAVWSRWQDDQKQLDGLRDQHGGDGGPGGASSSGGGAAGDQHEGSGPAGGSGASGSAGPSPGGGDRGGHGSAPNPGVSPGGGGEHGRGAPAPQPSGAFGDGGRHSTTSTSSTSSHSGDQEPTASQH
jgi:hypothetical protein